MIASASQVVSAGFNGLRYFELPTTPVTPGETLILAANEPLNMFHWQYGLDTYPNGQRFLNAVAQPGTDWVFQTFATVGDCNRDLVPDTCQLAGNDCNGNGDADPCDIFAGISLDRNGDGVPDECGGAGGDFNIDNNAAIDMRDFRALQNCFSRGIGMLPNCGDFDGEPDGDVDLDDHFMFESLFDGP